MPLPLRMPPKQARNKVGEYNLISKFKGYHAREDPTILTPDILVAPSQNVLIKTSGRIASVQGYTLDGAASSAADSGILSNFDFTNFKGDVRNLRAGFLTTAGNDGKLQYRYVNGTTVNWVDLKTGLTNVRLSYTEYWDNTALVKNVLWVDGSNNVFAWNGAVTTFASATAPVATVISTISSTPTAAGTGYAVNDILTISGGTGGSVRVVTIGGGGSVASIALYEPGVSGYSVASGVATTGGTGTGCTIQVTALRSAGTIVKQGTTTWAGEGFSNGSGSIVIGGVSYAYTGMGSSTTLMGVTPDPSSAGSVGAIIHQLPVTTALSAMTGILATLAPTVIGCGRRNQVYVGSSSSNNLYISKVNSYTDYSFTAPTRVVGEGALIPLDEPPVKFIPQEVRETTDAYDMYISEGKNHWGVIRATLSSDLTKETLEHIRLKVSSLQGALSEKLSCKMKNHIVSIGNDHVATMFGYMSYQYVPTMVDFSYPIIDDMNSYDFTDGQVFYYRNYLYVAIPKHGLIRVYNMTDQTQETFSGFKAMEDVTGQPWFWEAPITYPISGFYVTPDKGLCGHSYNSSESYQLFTGGSFNGQDITASAVFAYDSFDDRTQSKGSNELWVEGYIKPNTTLSCTIAGDLDAFKTSQTVEIDGSNNVYVAFGGGGNSLGDSALGVQTLGGATTVVSTTALPAWFHVAKTYPQVPFYLQQLSFSTRGIDMQWELITFGTNSFMTPEGNNTITD